MRGTLDISSTEVIHRLKERQTELVRQVMAISTEASRRERLVFIHDGIEESVKILLETLRSEE